MDQRFWEAVEKKNYEKAVSIMDKIVEKYPDFENLHMLILNRAIVKKLMNDTQGAIEDYTLAWETDTTYAEAIRQRGFAKKEMGDLRAALDDYEIALKIDPELSNAYHNKAIVLDSLGERERACDNYKQAFDRGILSVSKVFYEKCDQLLIEKSRDKTYGYTVEKSHKDRRRPRWTAWISLPAG